MRIEWDPSRYDAEHSYVARYGESLIDVLAPQAGERILDLGCGTGHLTQQIAERGATVVGIDVAPAMIEQARADYPDLDFHVANAADFSLPTPFDAVFSNAAIHWVPAAAQDNVAASIARALRPGGRLVVEFGARGNVGQVRAALEDALRTALPGVALPAPWYFPSIGDYASILERHNLEVVQALVWDRPTPIGDQPGALRGWIEMFAPAFVGAVPEADREAYLIDVERRTRPSLLHDGVWSADYRRLRLVAVRL